MKNILFCLVLVVGLMKGQGTAVNGGRTSTGLVDNSGSTHTLPVKVVANVPALPATCTAGELAVVTGATLGQQIYQCSAGNVWTQQLNSGTATGGGITMYSGTAVTVTANTYYIPVGGGGTPSTTETNVDIDSPAAATITNMYVQLSVALGVGNTGVFTFRKNAVSQSVTCTITGGSATACNDTTHSFNVSQGDLLTIQLVTTGTLVVTPNILIAAQFGNITATGTVNTGTIGQIAYYAANGAAVSGQALFAVNGQTGTYQVQQSDFTACKTISVASGTFNITLVASGSQPTTGQCIDVINYGTGVVTLVRSGQNINGAAANLTGTAGSATAPTGWHVVSDGTNYVASLWSAGSTSVNVPTPVQMIGARGNPITTLAYPFNVTSGNILVVALGWESVTNTNASIVDTVSTSWTRVIQITGNNLSNCAVFVGSAASSGADTITATYPASSGFQGIYVSEWTNLTTTTDGTASTTSPSSAFSLTTAVGGDLVVSFLNGDASGATNGNGPFLGFGTTASGNDSGGIFFYVQPKAGKLQTYVVGSGAVQTQCAVALQHS